MTKPNPEIRRLRQALEQIAELPAEAANEGGATVEFIEIMRMANRALMENYTGVAGGIAVSDPRFRRH